MSTQPPAFVDTAPSGGPLGQLLLRVGTALLRLPRALRLALALGWMGLIWLLSGSEMPEVSSAFYWPFLGNLFHAPLFGLLGLWWIAALSAAPGAGARPWPSARCLSYALLLVLAYAIVDELHQASTPGRSPSSGDVCTDLIGASSVVWVVAYLGSDALTQVGLLRRLGLGLLACCGAAGLATLF